MLTPLVDIREALSLTKGWHERDWQGRRVLAAAFGGNELRFRVEGTSRLVLRIATEPYVFCHVFADGEHIAKVRPEADPASIDVPVAREGSEVRFLRTAVSSGPFYVDAMVIDVETDRGACFLPPAVPVPSTTFATFGDSISGNCCIGDDAPYDPIGLGYGYQVCERFGWQYFNCARDGSGVCCTPFDNPLAIDRVGEDLIRHAPDFLLVFYGTNDVRNVVTPGEFRRGYGELMERIVRGLPETRIATSCLLWNDMADENRIESFNAVIREVSERHGLPYCLPGPHLTADDFDDGVHPNAEGQRKLAALFAGHFATHWPECAALSGGAVS